MSQTPSLPRLPYALLGLLTLACFGGPFALLIVRGGPSADWPPDRTIEWIVIALVITATTVLFLACVTLGLWYRPPRRNPRGPDRVSPAPVPEADIRNPSSGILNSES
jgi:hypothetical protein